MNETQQWFVDFNKKFIVTVQRLKTKDKDEEESDNKETESTTETAAMLD